MKPAELLGELETLSHNGRVKRMIELGWLSVSDNPQALELRQTIQTLSKQDFYQRFMALQSCAGSRDGARSLAALRDPSRKLRGLAISLIPLVSNDEQVAQALAEANTEARRSICHRLVKNLRQPLIQAFLQSLANQGDEKELVRLLSFGTDAQATEFMPLLEKGSTKYDWTRLAKKHPRLVAASLTRQAAKLERPDYYLLNIINSSLPWLAKKVPLEALGLVKALLTQFSLVQLKVQELVYTLPNEIAQLLLDSDSKSNLNFNRVIHRLDTTRLIELLQNQPATIQQRGDWLKRLEPEQRRAIYEACNLGWRQPDGVVAINLIEHLPADLRNAEARRHLALPALATNAKQRLPYAAYLPWEEARKVLQPYLGDPDPDYRVVAHEALGRATRYHRERLLDYLAVVRARRNEQDPVRLKMMAGLAGIAPGAWQIQHLYNLSGAIQEALNAADLSQSTAGEIGKLVIKVLPFHPQWSAEWLVKLVKTRGTINMGKLEDRITLENLAVITPILLPVLQAWATREREYELFSAGVAFGRLLQHFNGLVDLLIKVLKATKHTYTANRILGLLATHRRDRLPTLIPELIKEDPSWATIAIVYNYLHRWRQDLLTPFLGQTAYTGRFSTGNTRFVLPFSSQFHRWTPAQQAIFAQTLSYVTGDEARDTPAIIRSIAQLKNLLGIPPTRLITLASDSRQAIRDTAVRALGRLDAGEGVPELLKMMDDDRARIAIYALRRSILELPKPQALNILITVSMIKVTVAKEVVRLLGELNTEAAYRYLLSLNQPGLQRDIRVAILRGLWDHLERDDTWAVFDSAATDPDPAVAMGVVNIPTSGTSALAQRRLANLLVTLLRHPEPRVRTNVLKRCSQLPLNDSEQVLLPGLLVALESPFPEEYRLTSAAITATYTGKDARLVAYAFTQIMAKRPTLYTLVEQLVFQVGSRREQLLPTVKAVLEVLSTDPLTAHLQAKLATASLDWSELADFYTAMAARGELNDFVLNAARRDLVNTRERFDIAKIEVLEQKLATSPDPRLRWLALDALTTLAIPPRGWNDERIARLAAYRLDASPLVAAAAQFTFATGEV